jgi:cation/acetate symporter
MLLNVLVALTVASFTPAPPADIQEMVEEIRIPSGAGEAHELSA